MTLTPPDERFNPILRDYTNENKKKTLPEREGNSDKVFI